MLFYLSTQVLIVLHAFCRHVSCERSGGVHVHESVPPLRGVQEERVRQIRRTRRYSIEFCSIEFNCIIVFCMKFNCVALYSIELYRVISYCLLLCLNDIFFWIELRCITLSATLSTHFRKVSPHFKLSYPVISSCHCRPEGFVHDSLCVRGSDPLYPQRHPPSHALSRYWSGALFCTRVNLHVLFNKYCGKSKGNIFAD